MINGDAIGGGLYWAMTCDMRIGSERARFSVGFTKFGLFPGTGGTWLTPRLIGIGKAFEMIFIGRFVDAYGAEKIGIVNILAQRTRL